MLFTSGTTSKSKVVALSHKNLVSNVMDFASVLTIDSSDKILSFLPLHHVFECTVGMLYSLYIGAERSFCEGIRHIVENLNEYKITFASFVPAIYESMYKTILKNLEKQGKLEAVKKLMEENRDKSMAEKKEIFKDIHNIFGGNIKLFVSGAAALDKEVEYAFRDWGINLCQGYGLTETSPVIGVETDENFRVGSIGKPLPHVKARIDDANEEGMGEGATRGRGSEWTVPAFECNSFGTEYRSCESGIRRNPEFCRAGDCRIPGLPVQSVLQGSGGNPPGAARDFQPLPPAEGKRDHAGCRNQLQRTRLF